ncbi:MarR family winged helix-turn-helix transcriptional regulator [Poritiphilus flavus]|uniref:MarR family transcriptional regulator n=1 Tax=Poritiphilus flavus TaxID=2697053 RepID=A0A6L9E947_9FLAO|nr:MarR family transcriptional regulator [Poritiphilus flavus]NAS11122.1 MarR family transcriptional regulator [Poritiphilus flavus]
MKETKAVPRLENVLFYVMEKTIKSYRQFAQRQLNAINKEITIDQWLILKTLDDNPDITQREIAERVFKDHASITRMIDLLVKKGFLKRFFNPEDRRRYGLKLTPEGRLAQQQSIPVIMRNRAQALQGLSDKEIHTLRNLLQKITDNCTNPSNQKIEQ